MGRVGGSTSTVEEKIANNKLKMVWSCEKNIKSYHKTKNGSNQILLRTYDGNSKKKRMILLHDWK